MNLNPRSEEDNTLHRGWYKEQLVYYFILEEKTLEVVSVGLVPTSPIYVTFNIDPDDTNPNSGTPSGFVTEQDGIQTHNLVQTIPSDDLYSPLWLVYVYPNQYFDSINDLSSLANVPKNIQVCM